MAQRYQFICLRSQHGFSSSRDIVIYILKSLEVSVFEGDKRVKHQENLMMVVRSQKGMVIKEFTIVNSRERERYSIRTGRQIY
jgi:hypothetical protein